MPRIALRNLPADFLGDTTLAPDATVVTTSILEGAKQPITLKAHRLAADHQMIAEGGKGGVAFYVWSGVVGTGGAEFSSGSVLVAEHGAEIDIVAGPSGAMLIEMRNAGVATLPRRFGGQSHAIPADRLNWVAHHPDNGRSALYLDSRCPTCELWLHARHFRPDMQAAAHYHTEDEVMIIVDGEMTFGRRALSRGAVIFIENGTIYSFETGPAGANVINFRPSEPFVTVADGSRPPMSEVDLYRDSAAHRQSAS